MGHVRRPALPMPTQDEIQELILFLAANVSVMHDDGKPEKAERYQAMQNTVQGLAQRAVDLSEITRVVVAPEAHNDRAYDNHRAFTDGCAIDVQDDGRTLKLVPMPLPGTFI